VRVCWNWFAPVLIWAAVPKADRLEVGDMVTVRLAVDV
jgi:hypothetical protein